MNVEPEIGVNSFIGANVQFGSNVKIKNNCIIEDNVVLGDNVFIDNNCIIRNDVSIANDSTVGANCIIGEYQMDFFIDHQYHKHELKIGERALIRSGSIIYNGSEFGKNFQCGHHVTIREQTKIGDNVSIGTLSDVQGDCRLGNYVRLHSDIFIGKHSVIDDCVWIFPHVVFTNDPTPPSNHEFGVHIHSFAIIAANAILLPGVEIHNDALVGAGAIVTKDVDMYEVVFGNPAKTKGDVRDIKNRESGEKHYPWRYHFDRTMPWENFGFDNWYNKLDEEMKGMLLG